MKNSIQSRTRVLFSLQDECIQIVDSLKGVLQRERAALIGIDTATVSETNARKELTIHQLKLRRRQMVQILETEFGLQDTEFLDAHLSNKEKEEWLEKKATWLKKWEEARRLLESNQALLKHSLKNFGLLVDNLRRLFGEQPLYSAKGARVESPNQGKIVVGRY